MALFGKRIVELPQATSAANGDMLELSLAGGLGSRRITVEDLLTGSGSLLVGATGAAPVFNVRDTAYGALGNNTGNDATAINAAITAAVAAGGGIVYLPQGTYRTTAPIVVPANAYVSLLGSGWGTKIVPVGTFSSCIIIGSTSVDTTADSEFGGFLIDGTGLTGDGFTANRMHSSTFRRFRVMNCHGRGLVNFWCYASTWIQVYSANNTGNGCSISEAADLSTYLCCKFLANGGHGVHFTNGDSSGCRFLFCDFEGTVGDAFRVDTTTTMDSLVLAYNYFENNSGLYVNLGGSGGPAQVSLFVFTGNHVNPGAGSPTACAVKMDRVGFAAFQGNRFNTIAVTTTVNTGSVFIDQTNSFSDPANCPTNVLVAMPQGHALWRSVEPGHVDFGTDVDWALNIVITGQRRWQFDAGDGGLYPKGSLVPVTGQNPHLGSIGNPVQAVWAGSISRKSVVVSSNHTAAVGEGTIYVNTASGAVTITLPDPNTRPDLEFRIVKISSDANAVNITPSAGNINGTSTVSFTTQWAQKIAQGVSGTYYAA